MKCEEYILLAYSENTNGYRLVNPKNPGKIVRTRDVVFIRTASRNNNTHPEKHVEYANDRRKGPQLKKKRK
jgi:type IV secretory pathway component VirB8